MMKKSIWILCFVASFLSADMVRDDINEVVNDSSTGFMWQDDANASTITRGWEGAIDYCEELNLAGHSDWHLPNMNELKSIVDTSRINPAINPIFTNNTNSAIYWSATTYASSTAGAWAVLFNYGNVGWGHKTNTFYVRCVR